jgi:hypothetical protein
LATEKVDIGEGPLIGQEIASQYDHRTVFYDLFVDRFRRLRAIGPPPLNLEPLVFPLDVKLDKAQLLPVPRKVWRYRKGIVVDLGIVVGRLPPDTAAHLTLACGYEAVAPISDWRRPRVNLALVTQQKNNEPQWIADGGRYHAAHGVERLIVYDNGSDDLDAVLEVAEALSGTLDVVIVGWTFPFGLQRSWGNTFGQVGALNHAALAAANSSWMLCMDADEYLVVGGDMSLSDRLAAQSRLDGVVRFDSYNIPVTERIEGVPRATDFRYREREPRRHGWKYVARPRSVRWATEHDARVRPFLHAEFGMEDVRFHHILGLTTNWKGSTWDRLGPVEVRSDRHVRDLSVLRRFEELGIM